MRDKFLSSTALLMSMGGVSSSWMSGLWTKEMALTLPKRRGRSTAPHSSRSRPPSSPEPRFGLIPRHHPPWPGVVALVCLMLAPSAP